MMLFWILTAAMILVALVIIAPALLRKSSAIESDRDQQNVVIARDSLAELKRELEAGHLQQAEYDQAVLELEQSLILDLESRQQQQSKGSASGKWTLLGSTVLVSLLTVSLYLYLGQPQLINPQHGVAQQGEAGKELPSVEEMVAALTERLKQTPEDAKGWYLLGRTYMVMDEYQKAVTAFERAYALVDDQPSLMLALADATAMVNGGDMSGRPAELIRKAVQLAPDDPTALWLVGMVEDQSGNHQLAIEYWSRLRGLLGQEDQELLQQVAGLIESAKQKMGAAAVAETTSTVAQPMAASSPSIRLSVTVAEALKEKVDANATLFIYARAVSGPRMPLAAVRLTADDLPVEVTLDDSTAMAPTMKLSSQKEVTVGALLSSGGSATASPGDLRGEVSPVQVGQASVVNLAIDTLVE